MVRAELAPGTTVLAATETPRRVLILPYGTGIGDLALQRGLFAAIVRRWPEAEVCLYAPARARALVPEGVRVVPRILGLPAWDRVSAGERLLARLGPLEWRTIDAVFRVTPLTALAALPARAVRERYDVVVNLLGAFVGGVDFSREWLPSPESRPVRHVLDRLAKALARDGVPISPAERTLPLSLTDADHEWADATLSGVARPGPYLLLNPHAGSRLKLPGESFWRALVQRLLAAGFTPLVLAGGNAAEAARAERIIRAGGVLIPGTTLAHLISLGRRCAVVISPDTGLLHLLALDGQAWVGLFGSTNPYLLGPYDRSRGRVVLVQPPGGRACETCWQRFAVGSACCPVYPGGSCLTALDPDTVTAAALELARRAEPPFISL